MVKSIIKYPNLKVRFRKCKEKLLIPQIWCLYTHDYNLSCDDKMNEWFIQSEKERYDSRVQNIVEIYRN